MLSGRNLRSACRYRSTQLPESRSLSRTRGERAPSTHARHQLRSSRLPCRSHSGSQSRSGQKRAGPCRRGNLYLQYASRDASGHPSMTKHSPKSITSARTNTPARWLHLQRLPRHSRASRYAVELCRASAWSATPSCTSRGLHGRSAGPGRVRYRFHRRPHTPRAQRRGTRQEEGRGSDRGRPRQPGTPTPVARDRDRNQDRGSDRTSDRPASPGDHSAATRFRSCTAGATDAAVPTESKRRLRDWRRRSRCRRRTPLARTSRTQTGTRHLPRRCSQDNAAPAEAPRLRTLA